MRQAFFYAKLFDFVKNITIKYNVVNYEKLL